MLWVWRETGPDASECDEFPERSPQQRNATAPVAEENLGDLTVGRETGWMPIPLATDDYLRLNGQDGIILTVRAGDTRVDTRDGHNLTVIDWTGVYDGEGGVATGSVVSAGPLSGLLSTIDRSLTVPFGEENESVVLQETQVLERVLSPEIVSEDDNNPPVVSEIEWREVSPLERVEALLTFRQPSKIRNGTWSACLPTFLLWDLERLN